MITEQKTFKVQIPMPDGQLLTVDNLTQEQAEWVHAKLEAQPTPGPEQVYEQVGYMVAPRLDLLLAGRAFYAYIFRGEAFGAHLPVYIAKPKINQRQEPKQHVN